MKPPKPPLSYADQLSLLRSRGLEVADPSFALHCLRHNNYYRLSAYRFPFTQPDDTDQFLPGTQFEQIWELYDFDRKLRHLLLEASKRVEISVRSRWAYEMGIQLGPLSYESPPNFTDSKKHSAIQNRIDAEIRRSHEPFINQYRKDDTARRPEIWVAVEIISFGTTTRLLKHTRSRQIRKAVAGTYGMDEQTLCSFVHHLNILRNIAAHHGRIWNRKMVFQPRLPRKKPARLLANLNPADTRKIYNTLVILIHLLRLIEIRGNWPQRLLAHLATLPENLLPHMGFPEDWRNKPIWHEPIPTAEATQ